jgi:hypothetical protein
MNVIEKYMDALDAAIESKDKTAVALLEAFATHLYKDINKRTEAASGEERVAWEAQLQRIKGIIAGIVKNGPELW